MTQWSDQFKPFATKLSELDQQISEWVTAKTDDELTQLRSDAAQRANSNCWWAVYDVIPLVLREVDRETHRRKSATDA